MAENTLQQARQIVKVGDATIEELQAENAMLRRRLAEAWHQVNLLMGNEPFKVKSYAEMEQALRRIGEAYPAYNLIYLATDSAAFNRLQRERGLSGLSQQIHKALACLHASDPVGSINGNAFIAIVPGSVAEMLKYRLVDKLGAIDVQVYAASAQCSSPNLGLCLKPLIEEIENRLRGQVDYDKAPVAKPGRGAVFNGKSIE